MDPRQVAAGVVGAIDWQDDTTGFCDCPGIKAHANPDGDKDCRITLDGAPTIHCFHESCRSAVSEANLRLRRALASPAWSLALPGGKVIRCEGVSGFHAVPQKDNPEKRILKEVRAKLECRKQEILAKHKWPLVEIIADSPCPVHALDAREQYLGWLALWPPGDTVWIGQKLHSGRPGVQHHFRTAEEWKDVWPILGNYTCPSAFQPGGCSRRNESVVARRFLVVESDTLTKNEVGAVFRFMRKRLNYRLHCIIDTAGKSLHAWFDPPRNPEMEGRLKEGLIALGCDPSMFTPSQPVRVPGALRDGKLQQLIWLRL